MKISEVARILNVSRHTVLNWIRKGKIRAIRLPSGRYRIPESEVRRILEGGGNKGVQGSDR
ncbi:MAG: MerR family transcriptional regulator [Candidatus Baldrarchaeia archaeon]